MLGRHFNIMRANNKQLGSPVNRILLTAQAAARGAAHFEAEEAAAPLGAAPALEARRRHARTWREQWAGSWRVFVFRARLWVLSAAFHTTQLWLSVRRALGLEGRSFEQVLDDSMAQAVEEKLGLKLNLDGHAIG